MPRNSAPRRKPVVHYPALSPAARNAVSRAIDAITAAPQTPKDRP
jgi:hypothetical protein